MQFTNYFKNIYRTITGSIAFYPGLITLVFAFVAIGVITLDHYSISAKFADTLPFLNVNDPETARTILSTNIAGMISLTVFSFSMVMLMLNQAASDFSPRLLPGLISDKKHQFVLGFYMGTIIYSIIVLMNILPASDQYSTLGLSVAAAILFSLISLVLFSYFIHTISQSIQVSNILYDLYNSTRQELQSIREENSTTAENELPDSSGWYPVKSNRSGYLQEIEEDDLTDLAQKENTIIEICFPEGLFVLEGVPIALSRKELSKESSEKLLEQLGIYNKEYSKNNYVLAFKQITEVAVKAMSPAINDPGTALNAIDYLTELFSLRLKIKAFDNHFDDDNALRLIKPVVSFKDLIYFVMASLRQYTKHDVVIVTKLLHMFNFLMQQQPDFSYTEILEKEMATLLEDADSCIKNIEDRKTIVALVNSFAWAKDIELVQTKLIKLGYEKS